MSMIGDKFFHVDEPDFIYTIKNDENGVINIEFLEGDELNIVDYYKVSVDRYFKEGIWVKVDDQPNSEVIPECL